MGLDARSTTYNLCRLGACEAPPQRRARMGRHLSAALAPPRRWGAGRSQLGRRSGVAGARPGCRSGAALGWSLCVWGGGMVARGARLQGRRLLELTRALASKLAPGAAVVVPERWLHCHAGLVGPVWKASSRARGWGGRSDPRVVCVCGGRRPHELRRSLARRAAAILWASATPMCPSGSFGGHLAQSCRIQRSTLIGWVVAWLPVPAPRTPTMLRWNRIRRRPPPARRGELHSE